MIIGLIVIGGEAIMAYKTIPGAKRTQKKVHLMLHLVAQVSAAYSGNICSIQVSARASHTTSLYSSFMAWYKHHMPVWSAVDILILHICISTVKISSQSNSSAMAHIRRHSHISSSNMYCHNGFGGKIHFLEASTNPGSAHCELHRIDDRIIHSYGWTCGHPSTSLISICSIHSTKKHTVSYISILILDWGSIITGHHRNTQRQTQCINV